MDQRNFIETKKSFDDILPLAKRLWEFLSNEDDVIRTNDPITLFISCNWYDRAKAIKVADLEKQFNIGSIIIAGGIGRFSSKRAIELGAEAYEMKWFLENFGVDSSKFILFPNTKHTGDNVDRMLDVMANYSRGGSYLLVVEESYLIRRLRATIMGRSSYSAQRDFSRSLKGFRYGVISSGNSFEDFIFNTHLELDYSLYFLCQELDRLFIYSDENKNSYLFSRAMAFKDVEKYGSVTELSRYALDIYDVIDKERIQDLSKKQELISRFLEPDPQYRLIDPFKKPVA